jgi:WD40 repeat protein
MMLLKKQLFFLTTLLFTTQLTGKQELSIGFFNSVTSLCPLEKSSFVLGSADGKIQIFALNEKGEYEAKNIFTSQAQAVSCVASWDDNTFVSGSQNGSINVWMKKNEEYQVANTLTGDSHKISSAIRLNNNLISLADDGELKIWPGGYTAGSHTVKTYIGKVTAMTSLKNGKVVLSGESKSSIMTCLIEDNSFNPQAVYALEDKETRQPFGKIYAVTELENRDLIVACEGHIIILSPTNADPQEYHSKQKLIQKNPLPIITPLAGNRFASVGLSSNSMFGFGQHNLLIWGKNNEGLCECKTILEGHQSRISSIIQLENGYIVSGSHDGKVIIWNNEDQQDDEIL